jgi:hypothetical protein
VLPSEPFMLGRHWTALNLTGPMSHVQRANALTASAAPQDEQPTESLTSAPVVATNSEMARGFENCRKHGCPRGHPHSRQVGLVLRFRLRDGAVRIWGNAIVYMGGRVGIHSCAMPDGTDMFHLSKRIDNSPAFSQLGPKPHISFA